MLFNPLVGFLEEIISHNLTLLSCVGFHYVGEGRTSQKDTARELAPGESYNRPLAFFVVQMMACLNGWDWLSSGWVAA
jgi:hypothetical protein